MLGNGATYYRIELATSDPRQKEVWWLPVHQAGFKADALVVARKHYKGRRVRIVKVSEECVWANALANVANGDKP